VQKRLTRSEVPVEETWDLNDLYPSDTAWEEALGRLLAELPALDSFRGRLGESAAILLGCLERLESILIQTLRIACYADLKSAEDGTAEANQSRSQRADAARASVEAALSFLRPELLALPEGAVERTLAEEGRLSPYRPYLEQILAARPHTLSAPTEEALASLSEVLSAPYTIYNRAMNTDMQFPPVAGPEGAELEMSISRWEELETSPDPAMRRSAFDSLVSGFRAYQNTLAATLSASIRRHAVEARLRGFANPAEVYLKPERVPPQVYHNVIDIIQQEAAPHVRRYMNLRRRVLGLEQVAYCDLRAPLDPGYSPHITYREASDLILEALAVMGPEYGAIMEATLHRRWVDLVDNIGKDNGAFCHSAYGVHPYILITWTGDMREAFVLAHELGHAGHAALAMKYQKIFYLWGSGLFGEAPSTCNELLFGLHLLDRTKERRMRRWIVTQFLGTFMHNFVTHLLEAELERRYLARAWQDQPITAPWLTAQKQEILSRFFGGAVAIDEKAGLIWMRQPHYYMPLYKYTYAAGLSAACAVAQSIRAEGQPAVARWQEALKASGTKYAVDLFRLAGVEMENPETIRKAVAFFGSLVDELEQSYS
jgi:oligoendopeptidase F